MPKDQTFEYKVLPSQLLIDQDFKTVGGQANLLKVARNETTIINDLSLDGWQLHTVSPQGLLYFVRERPRTKRWQNYQAIVQGGLGDDV